MASAEQNTVIEFCFQRMRGRVFNASLFRLWSIVGIAKAGIYTSSRKKGNAINDLQPCMLEAYAGFCDSFDTLYADKPKSTLTGAHLKHKTLQTGRVRKTSRGILASAVDGEYLWRHYKDIKRWYLNVFCLYGWVA